MKVFQLMAILAQLPQDLDVIVNDNGALQIYDVDVVTHYTPDVDVLDDDAPCVVIQVNCD